MKGWQAIMIATVVVLVTTLALALMMPRTFRVERSIVIDAPIEDVWAQIGDLKAHAAWSPWITNDPTISVTWGHQTSGEGAYYEWTSRDAPPGRYTITKSEPPRHIDYEMVFPALGQPTGWMEASRADAAGATRLTWQFNGTSEGPLGGVVAMWMDSLVGSSFEEGLAQVKVLAEATPAPVYDGQPVITGTEGVDPAGALPPVP